ncbi:hypothetical protein BpHYR1_044978 [Brachionus plicatilis]|uniref:Uncharacterized protein n=1 Tax=Brachionus plicatilis TaxID=10195 RepID=A0A3M7Q7M3_BRAPC|nr:hypothetical protein BpHYR1_044978 [Brachionus plicatilis]
MDLDEFLQMDLLNQLKMLINIGVLNPETFIQPTINRKFFVSKTRESPYNFSFWQILDQPDFKFRKKLGKKELLYYKQLTKTKKKIIYLLTWIRVNECVVVWICPRSDP